jgi:hypothetical protein
MLLKKSVANWKFRKRKRAKPWCFPRKTYLIGEHRKEGELALVSEKRS